ncbi:thioredoxin domain-containing protein [Deinococcus sp. RIT780]|nr:thioredoxin domain-containing protein [Deinococcus sp. RIT780]MBX8465754.1 thioredoxin domain-containing protein [Deinococcus sp. RIT780]
MRTTARAVTLAASLILGGAQAQLMGTPAELAAQPALKSFTAQGSALISGATRVTPDVAGGRVVGVFVESDSVSGLARGIGAGWNVTEKDLPKLTQNLTNPQLLAAARTGYVDLTDNAGTDLIALKVTGEGNSTRYLGYVAMKVWPDSAFPPVKAAAGSVGAPNVLRIFSDFQCPYCKQLWDTSMRDWRAAPATYRVVHYEFPLSFHRNAQGAAEASECAAAQGRFMPFADQLFANFAAWTPLDPKDAPAKYAGYAKAAGLNTAAFKTCVGQQTFRADVEAQMKAGMAVNVQGTPTVFLNGMKLTDYSDTAELARVRAVTTARPGAATLIDARLKLFR